MKNIHIHIFEANGKLTKHKAFLLEELQGVLKRFALKLPLHDLDIVVTHDPGSVIPETGECGRAFSAHLFYIYLDSKRKDFKTIVKEKIPGTIAHEGHHVLRWGTAGYGETLGEAVISEGLACHCEEELTGQRQPWDHALSELQLKKYTVSVKRNFNKKPYDHYQWFYNGRKKGIPRWTGYSVGYYLVEQYLKKHPGKHAYELYDKPAKDFLR